jgi:hypothetical protein
LVRCESADRNFEPLQEFDRRDYEIVNNLNLNEIFYVLVVDGHFIQLDYGSGSNLWNVWITLWSRAGQKILSQQNATS